MTIMLSNPCLMHAKEEERVQALLLQGMCMHMTDFYSSQCMMVEEEDISYLLRTPLL